MIARRIRPTPTIVRAVPSEPAVLIESRQSIDN